MLIKIYKKTGIDLNIGKWHLEVGDSPRHVCVTRQQATVEIAQEKVDMVQEQNVMSNLSSWRMYFPSLTTIVEDPAHATPPSDTTK